MGCTKVIIGGKDKVSTFLFAVYDLGNWKQRWIVSFREYHYWACSYLERTIIDWTIRRKAFEIIINCR